MDTEPKYAVIGTHKHPRDGYLFSVFHPTLELAKAEAMRLAEKEGTKFLVLKVVGFANKKPFPIEWTDF